MTPKQEEELIQALKNIAFSLKSLVENTEHIARQLSKQEARQPARPEPK
jgi:hypothetical protein